MKRISIARLALAMLLLGSMATPSLADTLWYNGDYDLTVNDNSYQINQISPTLNARTYDDFVVPTGGWTINSLYSNNFLLGTTTPTITEAYWEIRQGVTGSNSSGEGGDGGTLLFSGTSSILEPEATGRSFDVVAPEKTVRVSGLNFFLDEGHYWLSVTPITSDADYVANSLTTGTGATGFNPGNGLACNQDLNYLDGSYLFNGPINFSMGIDGTAGSQVPLPPSILLLASALLRLGVHGFRVRGR